MNFGQAIKAGFKNYAVFEGRATRAEYWWWWLFTFLVQAVVWLFFIIVGGINFYNVFVLNSMVGLSADPTFILVSGFAWFLLNAVALALFIPSLSILVRRLRDTGRKAWYLLLVLVPVAGPITIIVMLLQPSKAAGASAGGQAA